MWPAEMLSLVDHLASNVEKYWFKQYKKVFFNLGSAEPTCSANSLQGTVKILILVLFLVSMFRQKFNNFLEVPRLDKSWKALI